MKEIIFTLFLFFALIVLPHDIEAARLVLDSTQTTLKQGDLFYVDVVADTAGETINAAEVTVTFPDSMVTYVESEEKLSVLSLWIKKPELTGKNTVYFSGVVPGGVVGEHLVLTRLFFKALTVEQGSITIATSTLLLHDGLGTPAAVTPVSVHIAIQSGDATLVKRPYVDFEPPESFTVMKHRDPDVFDGKAFLVFETQDKNSGIETYRVKEGYFGRYRDAVSPYKLQHQDGDRQVYVKAIDRAGNEIVSLLYPQEEGVWFHQQQHIFSILIVFISLCLLFFLYRVQRGKK